VKLQRAGLAAAPVQTSEDLWRDPQLRSRHAYAEITHPDIGRIEYPQSPASVATKTSNVTRAARLGEHTRAVLVEWLGLDAAEFDELISANAIWDAESVPAQSELDHSAP
jgi:crotonobetainyl-CoA:carnitine CoA-transferase CaiB-like acyl-CoA transferase